MRIVLICLALAAGIVTPVHADSGRWHGCYFGAHIGYGQATSHHLATGLVNGITPSIPWSSWNGVAFRPIPPGTDLARGAIRSAGPMAGGLLGCTLQSGRWASGLELDLAGASMNGERAEPTSATYHATNPRALGTFRFRAGYEQGNWLFYVTAGGAWSLVGIRARSEPSFVLRPNYAVNNNKETFGGVLGFGAEYAIDSNLSVKIEALYLHFASVRAISSNLGGTWPSLGPLCHCYERRVSISEVAVRIGVNYQFAGP